MYAESEETENSLANERGKILQLYRISSELAAIIGSDDDEITDETAAKLTALELALETKIENILQARQGLLSDEESMRREANRLNARANALERKAEWLKGYVHQAMTQVGVGKILTTTFTAAVIKSPPRVELRDGAEIPVEYRRAKLIVDLDKTAVLIDHKAGKQLPDGVTVTQGSHLKIS